jgi:hypothetical protein
VRDNRLVSTHWGVITADIVAIVGIIVAAVAAWLAKRSDSRSIAMSKTMAGIEQDRRTAERVPRLTARLECWGAGSNDFALAVWLETSEPLNRIKIMIQEARNMDGPIGFKPGQDGVETWPGEQYLTEGFLPCWQSDSLRPVAQREALMTPGTSAVWCMQLRSTAEMSGGAEAVRLAAMCWSARDWQAWQVPVPVTISDQARSLITAASKAPDV